MSEDWFLLLFFLLACEKKQDTFFKMLYLTVCLSSTLNVFLKELWQVPLDPSISQDWWGFPSGHMQHAAIFYIALAAYISRAYAFIIMPIILYGIYKSFIYHKYHDTPEMIAALSISMILLTIMSILYTYSKKYKSIPQLYGISIIFISIIIILFGLERELLFYHWLFKVLAICFAITTAIIFMNYQKKEIIINQKLKLLILIFFCIINMYISITIFSAKNNLNYIMIDFACSFVSFFFIIYLAPLNKINCNSFEKTKPNAI